MASSFKTGLVQAWRLARQGEWRQAARALWRALVGGPPGDAPPTLSTPAVEVPAAKPVALPDAPADATPSAAPSRPATTPAPTPAPRNPAARPALATHTAVVAPAPRPAEGGEVRQAVFRHSQGEVDYRLFLPSGWQDGACPLLLMLHGCTQDPDDFARGTRMDALAQQLGVLVLYPAQPGSANPARCWNWFSRRHQRREQGEPALLAALTHRVVQAHGVDARRVYVAGLSAGGAMAAVLGQTWPELFAAVGVHSGLAYGAAGDVIGAMAVMRHGPGADPSPAAGPALPLIVFHGDADATVHPANGDRLITAARGAAPPSQEVVGQSAAGQSYTRRIYPEADNGPSAEYWRLHGAGHAWAGGHADGSFTDPAGPDASAEMLRFFLAHPKPG